MSPEYIKMTIATHLSRKFGMDFVSALLKICSLIITAIAFATAQTPTTSPNAITTSTNITDCGINGIIQVCSNAVPLSYRNRLQILLQHC